GARLRPLQRSQAPGRAGAQIVAALPRRVLVGGVVHGLDASADAAARRSADTSPGDVAPRHRLARAGRRPHSSRRAAARPRSPGLRDRAFAAVRYRARSQRSISPNDALFPVARIPTRKIFAAAATQPTANPVVSTMPSSTCHSGGGGCSAARSSMTNGVAGGVSDSPIDTGLARALLPPVTPHT